LQRVFSGPLPGRWSGWPDLTTGERLTVLPVIALIFVLGLFPQLLTGVANPAVMQMLKLFEPCWPGPFTFRFSARPS
jgi:NADH-quinone oxidoreductase subunit M